MPPLQSVPMRGTPTTSRIEDTHETAQATAQLSQPTSQEPHVGATSCVVQENLPAAPTASQQPLERSNITNERTMIDMGTNTSDVMIKSTWNRLRSSCMEANTQNSLPIVDVLILPNVGDHMTIPHVNLSISGYEPDLIRTPGQR